MRPVDQMLADYERLTGTSAWPLDSFCWTVIRPALGDQDLQDRAGTQTVLDGPVGLQSLQHEFVADEHDAAEHAAWVIAVDGAQALCEANGFGGSLPPTLSALSKGRAREVVSFYVNEATGPTLLSAARSGEVQQYDVHDNQDALDEAPWLRDAVREVRNVAAEGNIVAFGLAVVERVSGVLLSEQILAGSWPVLRFAAHQEQRQSGREDAEEPDLAQAFLAAPLDQQREALVYLVERINEAVGLASEPAAANLVERIRRGETIELGPVRDDEIHHLADRLEAIAHPQAIKKLDTHSLAWRRMQAGLVLGDVLTTEILLSMSPRHGPLYHARWALDDQWPSTAASLAHILRLRPGQAQTPSATRLTG